MKFRILLLVMVTSLGCNAKSPMPQPVGLDRSTPSATFLLVQKGTENKSFRQVIGSYSMQKKMWTLIETLPVEDTGDSKSRLDDMLRNSKIDLQKVWQDSAGGKEYYSKILARINNLDDFLADAQKIIGPHNHRIGQGIVDVSIDGDRAIVTHNVTIGGYTEGDDGTPVVRETKMYMRKYGQEWLICPQEEWEDSEYKWTDFPFFRTNNQAKKTASVSSQTLRSWQ